MSYQVFIAADHRGVKLKDKIKELLTVLGHEPVDVGAFTEDKPSDYPDLAREVAVNVSKKKNARGILVCMTGIGHSIAANKVPGIYAALCYNTQAAQLSREHNNSNVLVLGSKFVTQRKIYEIIKAWLEKDFDKDTRHVRRTNKIKKIEKEFMK